MGNRDKSSRRREDSPIQKKRKTKHRSPSSSSSSSESELNKSDEIEVLYVKTVESEGGKKKKKKKGSGEKSDKSGDAANDRRVNDLNEITQQLLAATQRENELRAELTATKEERDKVKGMFEKCCREARTFQLRAEYAEGNVEMLESKTSNDPGLRQENIRLHTQVGDLMREKLELQKEIDDGKKKLQHKNELSKQLDEQIFRMGIEKEQMKKELEREKEKGKKEEGMIQVKKEEVKIQVKREARRESSERGSTEKKDDYYELKKEARRLRKERDEWKEDAEAEKKRNKEIERDFDNMETAVGILQEQFEDEKKKSESLELKLKEVEFELKLKEAKCRRVKDGEDYEDEKANGTSNAVDEEMKRLKNAEATWMEEMEKEKQRRDELDLQLKEARDIINKQHTKNVDTSEVWCQTEPEGCEDCPRLQQRIRLRDEAMRKERTKVQSEKANLAIEMGNMQEQMRFFADFYHRAMNGQHPQQPYLSLNYPPPFM